MTDLQDRPLSWTGDHPAIPLLRAALARAEAAEAKLAELTAAARWRQATVEKPRMGQEVAIRATAIYALSYDGRPDWGIQIGRYPIGVFPPDSPYIYWRPLPADTEADHD